MALPTQLQDAGRPLDSAERDVLRQMFLTGPVWDGDLVSKCGRSGLIERGLAVSHDGWQTLTEAGFVAAIEAGFGQAKEAWQNRRRSGTGERAAIEKIAQIASAVGFQAGEPALEAAGQIVSVLAANPEQIDRFMREGSELFIDGTFNPENGSLTYRSIGGDILHPSVLRQQKGRQQ